MVNMQYLLLSVFALFLSVRGQDLMLSANPNNVVNGSTKSLEVVCNAPSMDEASNHVILLQVDRLGEEEGEVTPIAKDWGDGPMLHVEDERYTVEGQLRGGAMLKVKIAEPEVADSGVYQCRFAFLNMALFKFSILNQTEEVTFTEPDEPTPPPMVPAGPCSCDQVWAEVKELRETLIAENKLLRDQLKAHSDLPSCRASFTARLKERSGKKFYSNHPMIFDSVLSNKGEAYDPAKGIFTAPCGGQYFFRLTMRSHQERDAGRVDGAIEANGTEVARTSVFTDNPVDHYEQASTGLVVTLKEGEEVMVRIQTNSAGKIYGDVYSVFSGFFISA